MTTFSRLQVIPYSTSFDTSYVYFLLGFAAIIGVIIAANKYMQRMKSGARISKPGVIRPTSAFIQSRTFRKEIREVAALCALDTAQTDFFSRLCTKYHISNPLYLLRNEKMMDEFFSHAFHALAESASPEKDKEVNKTILFTIREALDNYRKSITVLKSTRSVNSGQEIVLITPREEHYPTVVLENSARGLICRIPRDEFGNEIRLPLWTKVSIFFSTDSGQSYQCTARILRYESGTRETYGILSHTDSLKVLPSRRHERVRIDLNCRFRHVRVANVVNGRQTIHRFYPEGKEYNGTLSDISSGGCSLLTLSPLTHNEYIEIQCTLDGKYADTMTGKIVDIEDAARGTGSVGHVKFAKMPRATMNRIFTLIFNFGDTRT